MELITASESGKNAYYLGACRITEHNPAYCACLDKIKRKKAGQPIDNRCDDAIRTTVCQALAMRQAEELAGHALYFVPRDQLATSHNKVPPWAVPPEQSPVTKPSKAAKPVKGAVDVTVGGSYADAINAAMKSSAAPVTPAVTLTATKPLREPVGTLQGASAGIQPAAIPAMPGESPIAYAKRRAAALKGETA